MSDRKERQDQQCSCSCNSSQEQDKNSGAVRDEKQRPLLPQVNFTTFIMSLNTSALVHLGEIPEPGKEEPEMDLELARHTIDTIAMLKEKTRGNLDEQEQQIIDAMLYELRMLFIKKAG